MPPKKQQQQQEKKDAAATAAAVAGPAPSPKQQAKARSIQLVLDHLYPNPPIPLNHVDNFTLLIAVILSAQTTDGKVNEVTKELFRLAPTPQALAAMPYDKVLSIIRPVGLAPGKSKNIIGAAKMICERFDGQVPSTFEDLESLPGVGHKTASVVMTQAFGYPALPVDTHVHRLALRWGLSKSQDVKKVEADLKALYPPESWAKLGLQMIYFGREYCAAKTHTASQCPICSWANGSKPAPKEGEMGTFLAGFSSPAKANRHIILYSERSAVEGTAMLGPVTLKMEAETDTKVKIEVQEEEAEEQGKGKGKGTRGGRRATVKTETTTTTSTTTTKVTTTTTTTTTARRKSAGAAPAPAATAAAAAGSRKRSAPAPAAAKAAPAAATRGSKRAKRK